MSSTGQEASLFLMSVTVRPSRRGYRSWERVCDYDLSIFVTLEANEFCDITPVEYPRRGGWVLGTVQSP